MRAFIGLCIIRSFYTDLRLQQLYDDTLGPAVFKATMGGKRFGTILRHITFDDRNTREERRKGDKFCHIRELFTRFDDNLRQHFSPLECITVDERLLRFRGRCPFEMYLPSKRDFTGYCPARPPTPTGVISGSCGRIRAGRIRPKKLHRSFSWKL